jgi:hypothetical protein
MVWRLGICEGLDKGLEGGWGCIEGRLDLRDTVGGNTRERSKRLRRVPLEGCYVIHRLHWRCPLQWFSW